MEEYYCPYCGGIFYSMFYHECPKTSVDINYDSCQKETEHFTETPEANAIGTSNEIRYLNTDLISRAIRLSVSLDGDGTNSFPLEEPIASSGIFQVQKNPLVMTPSYSLDNYQKNTFDSSLDNAIASLGGPVETSQGNFCGVDDIQWNPSDPISSQKDSEWCNWSLVPEEKLKNIRFSAEARTTKNKNRVSEDIIRTDAGFSSPITNSTRSVDKVGKRVGKKREDQMVEIKTRYLTAKLSRIDDCTGQDVVRNEERLANIYKTGGAPVAGPSAVNPRSRGNLKEKRFVCDVCSKGFSGKHDFQKHCRTHTGEKPFKCTLCNREFTQKITLQNHFRIHTGEKPYTCEWCDQRCRTKRDLTKHYKRNHPKGGHYT